MKTALYITDCSVDAALSLRNWLSTPAHQPVQLTIVLPYDIEEGQTLDKHSLQAAKSAAIDRLKKWSAMLGDVPTGSIRTDVLLASPELAISLHLLIRRYDYWFVDDWSTVAQDSLASILNQPTMQTLPLAINLEPTRVTV